MAAPKRIWSGNWEDESAALSQELANRRAQPVDAAPEVPRPPRPRPARPRPTRPPSSRLSPRLKTAIPIALALLLMLAAAAYGLSQLGSSSQSAEATLARSSGPVRWLGMQIESFTPGGVVVQTVALGSPAEAAGLEPGDVLREVNGHSINSTGDLTSALSGQGQGDVVQIQADRGSTQVTTQIVLAAPPSGP